MRRHRKIVPVLFLALAAAACATEEPADAGATSEEAAAAAALPLTTESAEARNHFVAGQRALDMGRPDDARPHFEQAVAADPEFAMAYFGLAGAANSVESFRENLDLASAHAAHASEIERLRIDGMKAGFEGDLDTRMTMATRLTAAAPESPRAWMDLAAVQSGAGDEEAARSSLEKAIAADPDFAPAHLTLAASHLFVEPLDAAAAQRHAEHAVELEPDEAVTHDVLGDAYRAQGMLEEAAAEYGRTAELDPASGNGYQQRGHVHTFLGDYEQARADYDAAIEIEKGKNAAPSFGVYRALVSVHEGDAAAAVDELDALIDRIDEMGIPGARGQKLFARATLIQIALHEGMLDRAEAAIEAQAALLDEQAAAVGTEAARRNLGAIKSLNRGWLAARRGDLDGAVAAAEEARATLEPGTDPERYEPVHELLGFVSLQRGDADEAVQHYEQADPDDIYTTYHHALALEAAGRADEASALYEKVTGSRFNAPGLALVRSDAQAKVGE